MMIKGFEFEEGGRQYVCTVEARVDGEDWWWFAVSGDAQRYAPFRAERSDTRGNVQERIVEFYDNRVFQLAQPRERGSHWGSRKRTTDSSAATPKAADA